MTGSAGLRTSSSALSTDDGRVTYEPVDAKLARSSAKPGHVLQLCFYAEAIAAQTGRRPEQVHIELGSGVRETIRVEDVMAYWRRLRATLATLVEAPPSEPTCPEPCDHCGFCEFEPVCQAEWRAADSLIYVAGARQADRELLETDGVDTLAGTGAAGPSGRQDSTRCAKPSCIARPRCRTRLAWLRPIRRPSSSSPRTGPTTPPPAQDDRPPQEPILRGFAALPKPAEGDVFLDYEGHPFWKADVGLFFLFGLIEQDAGQWVYRAFWAHDRSGGGPRGRRAGGLPAHPARVVPGHARVPLQPHGTKLAADAWPPSTGSSSGRSKPWWPVGCSSTCIRSSPAPSRSGWSPTG